MKIEVKYEIVIKPTTEAFCRGKRCYKKIVPEFFLDVAKKALDNDVDVERYFVKELTFENEKLVKLKKLNY
ncbi:MAG: hypothetical protein IJ398_06255 [Clostridia bacterium]|nr:hypothetical protein [Clostridia bacterium]